MQEKVLGSLLTCAPQLGTVTSPEVSTRCMESHSRRIPYIPDRMSTRCLRSLDQQYQVRQGGREVPPSIAKGKAMHICLAKTTHRSHLVVSAGLMRLLWYIKTTQGHSGWSEKPTFGRDASYELLATFT